MNYKKLGALVSWTCEKCDRYNTIEYRTLMVKVESIKVPCVGKHFSVSAGNPCRHEITVRAILEGIGERAPIRQTRPSPDVIQGERP